MSSTDTEIKATLTAREDSTRYKLSYPLAAFLEQALTAAQRELMGDAKPDIYLDKRLAEEAEEIVITFYIEREARPDAQGALVEHPQKPIDRCATKSELAQLRTELEAVARVALEGGLRVGG